ncbi:MAG: hypothetical protein JST35_06505 [Armatimonadetes bacterium]|nr:hypothetical protein [Armatimonadota bacterium]
MVVGTKAQFYRSYWLHIVAVMVVEMVAFQWIYSTRQGWELAWPVMPLFVAIGLSILRLWTNFEGWRLLFRSILEGLILLCWTSIVGSLVFAFSPLGRGDDIGFFLMGIWIYSGPPLLLGIIILLILKLRE